MIKSLKIKHLILIESCEINFDSGLTVITGETGAGKTALVEALALVLGQRSDVQMIRKGEEKASIEACIELPHPSPVFSLLQEQGINVEKEEFLIISREISKEGRSRSWINSQSVSLNFLQKISSSLLGIINQHSQHKLRATEFFREMVDLFGDLHEELSLFQGLWTEEKKLHEELNALKFSNSQKERELDICRFESEELEEAQLKENEEENLYEIFKRLSSSQEIAQKLETAKTHLSDSPQAVLPSLTRVKHVLQSLQTIDPRFKEPSELIQDGLIAIQEASHFLSHFFVDEDLDERQLETVNQRLSTIHSLKRKYDKTVTEILLFQEELKVRISQLENLEHSISLVVEQLAKVQEKLDKAALLLTIRRTEAANILEKKLTEIIRSLNMPKATIHLDIKPSSRSAHGDDQINCILKANRGEEASLVKEQSSGGELCRILLALHVVLAEKNQTPTIVFDEIDANVGGETASLMAEKLKTLGHHRQIFCITHFPQVAYQADHHLHVYKEEVEERTRASIRRLQDKEREKELLRMLGGHPLFPSS